MFARFCREALTTNEGAPLEIEAFQRRALTDFFGGTRSTLIVIPKKNGKTTLLGALALFHLLSTPDAECVVAAASREQAGIMLRQIRGFIRRSEALSERLDVTQRVISYERLGGQIRILASDVDTVDGAIPTLALIDELHRHKHPDLYGVLRDGLGPRQGQLVTISTAGDDENSPLGRLRQAAYALPGMVRDGAYRYVRAEDFALHEWALEADQDRDDLELVGTANPASWQTITELRRRRDDPSTMPWQWARFACGIWIAGEDSAISEKEWRACAAEGTDVPPGAHGVHVGVDLAFKWDTTAFVPCWRPDGDDVVQVGRPVVLEPPRDGTSLSWDEVWQAAVEMTDRWPGCSFVLDPSRDGEHLAQRIDGELDARVAVHSQDPKPMSLAAQRLAEAIAGGKLRHPDDQTLNAHVLAAGAYFMGERWKFAKQKRKNMPIDAIVALAMGHSTLVGEQQKSREVVFL